MTTYVLVHGGCHGAWCWDDVRGVLRSLGHDVIAVDMPIENPALTALDYAVFMADAVGTTDDVVLVGHSLAGYVVPFAAELISPRAIVYVAAALQERAHGERAWPQEPRLLLFDLAELPLGDDHLIRMPPSLAADFFFTDVDAPARDSAISRLRPQGVMGLIPPRLPNLPIGIDYGYVVCTKDALVNPAWQRWAASEVLPARTIELATGHSPFLTNARGLAEAIVNLA